MPADNALPTQAVIGSPLGGTRFVTAYIAERFSRTEGCVLFIGMRRHTPAVSPRTSPCGIRRRRRGGLGWPGPGLHVDQSECHNDTSQNMVLF